MTFDINRRKRVETARFTFTTLADVPIWIECRPLSWRNAELYNAVFKRPREDLGEQTPFETRESARLLDCQTIADFCAVAWNVTRGGGEVECTPANVIAFLRFAIENDYTDEIDALRRWAKRDDSFREPMESAVALGKE